jgi:hypothetical protein
MSPYKDPFYKKNEETKKKKKKKKVHRLTNEMDRMSRMNQMAGWYNII